MHLPRWFIAWPRLRAPVLGKAPLLRAFLPVVHTGTYQTVDMLHVRKLGQRACIPAGASGWPRMLLCLISFSRPSHKDYILNFYFSDHCCQSLSGVQLFVTPWTRQASLSFTISQSLLGVESIESVMPSNHLILFVPFSSYLQSVPASRSFRKSQFFTSGGQSLGVSASASVLLMNIQDWLPLDWLVRSPCSPKDSQESSPAPQFKSINSLALSLLYGPTFPSVHDYWKDHS